jgi:hypothetical protein
MVRGLVTLIFLVCFLAADAQLSDSTGNYLAYAFTGNYNQANKVAGFLSSHSVAFGHRSDAWACHLNLKHLYGRQRQELTNNDLTVHFDVNRYAFVPRFYFWGLASYGAVYSLKVHTQFQTGAGAAYDLISTGGIEVNVSDGLLYDYSDVDLSESTRLVRQTPRNSLRLRLRLKAGVHGSLQSAYMLQNSLEHGNDLIHKAETTIMVRIRGQLSARFHVQYCGMSSTDRETLLAVFGLHFSRSF